MIVFDLQCRAGDHRFEGWFGSSDAFARQQSAGLLCCPFCGSADVVKAVMAPAVGRKGNQAVIARPEAQPEPVTNTSQAAPPMPPELAAAFRAVAEAQAKMLPKSRWVGGSFAEKARAIHYGEADTELIHGRATPDEARALHEEGIGIAPLIVPFVPPEEQN